MSVQEILNQGYQHGRLGAPKTYSRYWSYSGCRYYDDGWLEGYRVFVARSKLVQGYLF